MQVIGFYFTKILAERHKDKVNAKPVTSIEFVELEEDKVDLLKESVAIRINFKYSLTYEETEKKNERQAEVDYEGRVIISVSSEEAKEIIKDWKNKKLPQNLKIFLFNVILRKCTPRTISIQDELNLPFHTPMPKLAPKKQSS